LRENKSVKIDYWFILFLDIINRTIIKIRKTISVSKFMIILSYVQIPTWVLPRYHFILIVYRTLNKDDITSGEHPGVNLNTPLNKDFVENYTRYNFLTISAKFITIIKMKFKFLIFFYLFILLLSITIIYGNMYVSDSV